MNLLLFREHELRGTVGLVSGERAEHIRAVLKKRVGDTLKVGVAGKGRGLGTVVLDSPDGVSIEVSTLEPDPTPRIHLIIALPRPLALSRLLHTAASFGVLHVDLIRAWKVPRSYFSSPRLEPNRIAQDLQLGAEQGGQSFIPSFTLHDGFRRFIEDSLPDSPHAAPPGHRFVLEPEAPTYFPDDAGELSQLTMSFGPEGGFIPSEVDSFEKAGFRSVRLGPAILTTEIAIAASLAQLSWLGRLATEKPSP